MRDIISYARDLLFCLLLPFTAWCVFIPQPVARADGGAPNLAYIAGTPTGVSVIDVQRQRISRTLHVGGDPQDILLSLDGSLLYATQPAQEQMAVINAQTGAMVCTAPVPFHPSLLTQIPSGDMLFVGSGTAVRAIDPHTCVMMHLFQVHTEVAGLTTSFSPGAFPNAGTTYQLRVASGHTLTVFDTGGRILGRFSVPADPQYLLVPPQSAFLYLTTRAGTVMAFDIGMRTFTAPLLTGGVFGPMDYDDSNGEVFIPDRSHGQVNILPPLDPAMRAMPNAPERHIHLSGAPVSVAIASGGQWGFVVLQDGRVAMLDIPGRRVVALINVGGSPNFVIIGSYPPLLQNTLSGGLGESSPSLSVRWRLAALVLLIALFLLGVLVASPALLRCGHQREKNRQE